MKASDNYRVVLEIQTADGTQKHVDWFDFSTFEQATRAEMAAFKAINELLNANPKQQRTQRKRASSRATKDAL